MIRAVIFDWGGVLADNLVPFAMKYVAHHLGVRREDAIVHFNQYSADFAIGTISESTFWKYVCNALNVGEPDVPSLWGEALRARYIEKHDVFGLIDVLKRKGYKIGLLSNCEMPAVEIYHERNYHRHFDAAVLSCTEGVCKPDRKIYEIALERLGVEAHEAVFIDDKEENILAAQESGLYGIVFVNPGQVREELDFLLNKENA